MTTSLMALAGGVTVSALAGGIRVWQRAVEFGSHQQASLITLTQMERDLHNLRRFQLLPFDGTAEEFSFAAVERADAASDSPAELGRRGYTLDRRRHVLCRSFTPFPYVKNERVIERCHAVLEDVSRVHVQYFGKDPESGETRWVGRWRAAGPPDAVKVELVMGEGLREPLTQTALIAVGSGSPDELPKDTR